MNKKSTQLFLLAFLITLTLGVAILLGFGMFLFNKDMEVKIITSTPTKTNFPHTTKTKVPTFTPTPTPIPTPAWIWYDMPEFGIQINIPSNWQVKEYSNPVECTFGDTLARFVFTNPRNDYLEVYISCPPLGKVRVGPCINPVVLDVERKIYRQLAPEPITIYAQYSNQLGQMQCPVFGWPVNGRYVSGSYYNRNFSDPDYPTVDRVLLSVRKKP